MRWALLAAMSWGCVPKREATTWSGKGDAAYNAGRYARCGALYDRAGDASDAACCHALAGRPDEAFRSLKQATEVQRAREELLQRVNAELLALFEADQTERMQQDIDWQALVERDEQRLALQQSRRWCAALKRP